MLKKILKNILVEKELFKKVFAYSIVFFALFAIIGEVFTRIFAAISAKLPVAGITESDIGAAAGAAEGLYGILFALILLFLLFMLLQLYNYSFFENLIWNTIFRKKTTFRNTNKFLGLNIILIIIFAVLLGAVFLVLAKLPAALMEAGIVVFYLAVLLAVYLAYTGYISFGKTHEIFRSIKNTYFLGIKKLNLTIIPLVIAVIIGIAMNFILMLFASLPAIANTVIQTIAFAAYLAWFRIYLANALK